LAVCGGEGSASCPNERAPWCLLNRRLGGPQNQCGCFRVENIFPLLKIVGLQKHTRFILVLGKKMFIIDIPSKIH